MKKATRGRPPRTDKANDYVLQIRLTVEEKKEIEAAAKLANTSTSNWARRALLAFARITNPEQ